jgi:hypothetical protein
MTEKHYDGNVYIGVVGPEMEYGRCRDSIEAITRRAGDLRPNYCRATKGFEARQFHLKNMFYNSKADWCLLLDHDQVFHPNTLERLRSHGVSFVAGYYMRRRWSPTYPVWFYYPRSNMDWPRMPYHSPPVGDERGLVRLGATGWGCTLVHRQVLEDVLPILKGEDWILEDDMDIWPYDLEKVMGAVNGLKDLVELNPDARTFKAAVKTYSDTLSDEIRILRGMKDFIGSDIRFPFFAREAGHTLWGDIECVSAHIIYYELSPFDFEQIPDGQRAEFKKQVEKKVSGGRREARKVLKKLQGAGQ